MPGLVADADLQGGGESPGLKSCRKKENTASLGSRKKRAGISSFGGSNASIDLARERLIIKIVGSLCILYNSMTPKNILTTIGRISSPP